MPGYGHSARARVFGPEERVSKLFLRSLSGPGLTARCIWVLGWSAVLAHRALILLHIRRQVESPKPYSTFPATAHP